MSMLYRTAAVSTAALALLAATLAVSPADAQVRRRGGDGAGVLGGLAAGALVGGALVGGAPAGPDDIDPNYGPDGAEGPSADEGCPLVRQPVYDGAGRFAGYRAVPAC